MSDPAGRSPDDAGAPPPDDAPASRAAPADRPSERAGYRPDDADATSTLFGEGASWTDGDDEEHEGPRSRVLGVLSLVLASMLFLANVVGIVLANTGTLAEVALVLAFATMYGTIVTLLMGAVAVIAGLGRPWGLAAVIVSFLGNPFVMIAVLRFVAGTS